MLVLERLFGMSLHVRRVGALRAHTTVLDANLSRFLRCPRLGPDRPNIGDRGTPCDAIGIRKNLIWVCGLAEESRIHRR